LRDGDRRALPFITQVRRLYRIEAQTKDLTPQERSQVRQREAAPIWTQLQQDAQALKPQLLPKSSLGKAVSYLINEYPALIGYLESGTYLIDNNLVENSIRVPAVGRRRWLFLGHPEAGWRSAVGHSNISTTRLYDRCGSGPEDSPTLREKP